MNNDDLKLSSYDFDLPKELIAQKPTKKRDECRLLVLDRETGVVGHKLFADMLEFLKPGDCLVINNTKVIPARIYGKKKTGRRVEVLFLETCAGRTPEGKVKALLKPFLEKGEKIFFPGKLEAVVSDRDSNGWFTLNLSGTPLRDILVEHGQMPLPPYIRREKINDPTLKNEDITDYQTVYSIHEGSVAAPTAGLHFTKELLNRIKEKGVDVIEILLHVGWGTFRPVRDEDITKHTMLPEYYNIGLENFNKIMDCKKRNGRVFAVGTTSVRALESAFGAGGEKKTTEDGLPVKGETSIFIYPQYEFKVVDCFLTNLHTPKSTPLMMTCAFASRDEVFAAYRAAIENNYRFFSYGDAMLIL
jgi:S-adenosylmethionine:tRNA ribosyltransferase-isomerase